MTDAKDNENKPRTERNEFEAWKHFAAMGGTDKNTMIAVVGWLLAFSATAIGYIISDDKIIISARPLNIQSPGRMAVAALVGIAVSIAAGYLALLYGGYSNRNWAMADKIARKNGWDDLTPEAAPKKMTPEIEGSSPGFLARPAWNYAYPCCPQTRLAPVFIFYFAFALLSFVVHFAFLLISFLARK